MNFTYLACERNKSVCLFEHSLAFPSGFGIKTDLFQSIVTDEFSKSDDL